MTPWQETVAPRYEALKEAEQQFQEMDLTALSDMDITLHLVGLAALEHGVILAWAEVTQDINPGWLEEVKNNRKLTLFPAMRETLEKILEDER